MISSISLPEREKERERGQRPAGLTTSSYNMDERESREGVKNAEGSVSRSMPLLSS